MQRGKERRRGKDGGWRIGECDGDERRRPTWDLGLGRLFEELFDRVEHAFAPFVEEGSAAMAVEADAERDAQLGERTGDLVRHTDQRPKQSELESGSGDGRGRRARVRRREPCAREGRLVCCPHPTRRAKHTSASLYYVVPCCSRARSEHARSRVDGSQPSPSDTRFRQRAPSYHDRGGSRAGRRPKRARNRSSARGARAVSARFPA